MNFSGQTACLDCGQFCCQKIDFVPLLLKTGNSTKLSIDHVRAAFENRWEYLFLEYFGEYSSK
jgi:hypothetical protein